MGNASKILNTTTYEDSPSPPQNVQVRATSSVSIHVKWDEPAFSNGIIKEYIISYGKSKDYQPYEQTVTGNTMERVLDGLDKFTTYFIKVRGKTSETGNASIILNTTTYEDSPGPPTQFVGQVMSDIDMYLSWKDPVNSNGIVRFYYIRIYDTKTGQQVKNLVNETARKQDRLQWVLISDLKPFTNYTFTIQAVTIKPGEMANVTARTHEGVPSQPRDVTAKLVNDDIIITWAEPQDQNGILTRYKVFCEGIRPYNSSFKTNIKVAEAVSSRRSVIRKEELKPGTEYHVYVKATTVRGDGVGSYPVVLQTPSKAPPPPLPPRVIEDDVTPTTITISLTPSSDNNGKIIVHQVIVEKVGKVSKREAVCVPKDIYGYKEAQANGDRFYIAAQFDRGELLVEFILGNGRMYGRYENAPLQPETRYKAYLRGVTEHNGTWLLGEPAAVSLPPTGTEKEPRGLRLMEITIASVVGSVIFIVLAALAAILFKKHRAGRKPNIPDDAAEEEITPYATVRFSSIFPLNAENNGPGDIPLRTLPFQLRTPPEERATGGTDLRNSPYENTDHLRRSSMNRLEYLYYQPRYENEVVDSETRGVVIRPGYDKLVHATRKKRRENGGAHLGRRLPCGMVDTHCLSVYDSLVRETDLRCKSRRGDITDSESEDEHSPV